MGKRKKWMLPLLLWASFEGIAVAFWLTKDDFFYFFNFSYIGTSIALGIFLFQMQCKQARRIV